MAIINKNLNSSKNSLLFGIKNALLRAAMADLPAMMTASGWRLNEKGDYVLDLQDKSEVKLLRDNLLSISEISPTHPIGVTLFGFGKGVLYGLLKLPEILKLITHPTWRPVGVNIDLRNITPIIPLRHE